jgi:hypothetical protein
MEITIPESVKSKTRQNSILINDGTADATQKPQ